MTFKNEKLISNYLREILNKSFWVYQIVLKDRTIDLCFLYAFIFAVVLLDFLQSSAVRLRLAFAKIRAQDILGMANIFTSRDLRLRWKM